MIQKYCAKVTANEESSYNASCCIIIQNTGVELYLCLVNFHLYSLPGTWLSVLNHLFIRMPLSVHRFSSLLVVNGWEFIQVYVYLHRKETNLDKKEVAGSTFTKNEC